MALGELHALFAAIRMASPNKSEYERVIGVLISALYELEFRGATYVFQPRP